MKTIFTAFLFLFIGNGLMAQTIMVDSLSIDLTPKAKLLYETDKGLVYALPQDNMRCLIPKIQSDMPVASAEGPGYIPNPLFQKRQSPIKTIPLKNSPLTLPKEFFFQKSETFDGFPMIKTIPDSSITVEK